MAPPMFSILFLYFDLAANTSKQMSLANVKVAILGLIEISRDQFVAIKEVAHQMVLFVKRV